MAEMQYDGSIACSDDGLIIRRYDLLLRPKTVSYTEIRRTRQVELHGFRFGNWRLWGSSDFSLVQLRPAPTEEARDPCRPIRVMRKSSASRDD